MSDETFKAYLSSLNIPADDKKYVLSFFKKADYFESLREIINQDTGETIAMGYGNFNSKIGFVVEDKSIFEVIKPLIVEYMDKFDINIWNTYLTFIKKAKTDYQEHYSLLVHELHAVNPNVLYFFVRKEETYNQIISEYENRSVKLPTKVFHIVVPEDGIDNNALQKQFFDMFKYLINYKEIE